MAAFDKQSDASSSSAASGGAPEHRGGMIGQIRALVESEQFDLANYTEPRVKDLIVSSFSTPLTNVKEMIRIQFIIGGGKLVRQKYDEEMIKWATAALREIGFAEDKSAAETLDSQGTYKHQHDTGQNLKYLIVYPKVAIKDDKSARDEAESASKKKLSAQEMIRICETATFKDMVASKVRSWRQKKGCVKCIQDFQAQFVAIEAKLAKGQMLTPEEQEFYDTDKGNLQDKLTYLQGEIKSMVDGGNLTASEKDELLVTLDANMKTALAEKEEKAKEGKPTKPLEEKLIVMKTKRDNVAKIATVMHPLKYSTEIRALHMKIFPLQAMEDKAKGVTLTLAELRTIGEKADFEKSITEYEAASRGWFEEEDDFKIMCENELKQAKAFWDKNKPKPKGTSGQGKPAGTGANKAKPAASGFMSGSVWSAPKSGGAASKGSSSSNSSSSRGGGGNKFGYLNDDD